MPPPTAVPPAPGTPAGEFGFRFDRLGPRVCTVLVSPWIEAGTVFRARDAGGRELACDHTSVIRTVCARFGLPPLTARDAAAPDVGGERRQAEPADRPAPGRGAGAHTETPRIRSWRTPWPAAVPAHAMRSGL